MKTKIIVLLTTLALSAALFAVASAATGAYFSDTHGGAVGGTIGAVKITAGLYSDTSGGLNFSLNNLLPGDTQSTTVYYKNTGTAPQDIWIVFPMSDGLYALNHLGRYGTVAFTSSGGANWSSSNLGWEAIPAAGILLDQNLAVGATGSMAGTFGFTGELTDSALEGLSLGPVYYNIVATQHGQKPQS